MQPGGIEALHGAEDALRNLVAGRVNGMLHRFVRHCGHVRLQKEKCVSISGMHRLLTPDERSLGLGSGREAHTASNRNKLA